MLKHTLKVVCNHPRCERMINIDAHASRRSIRFKCMAARGWALDIHYNKEYHKCPEHVHWQPPNPELGPESASTLLRVALTQEHSVPYERGRWLWIVQGRYYNEETAKAEVQTGEYILDVTEAKMIVIPEIGQQVSHEAIERYHIWLEKDQ